MGACPRNRLLRTLDGTRIPPGAQRGCRLGGTNPRRSIPRRALLGAGDHPPGPDDQGGARGRGSARRFPGESSSRAAAFGTGLALDVMPGCADLAMLADAAAGEDDRYESVSDDELIGVLCPWDRLEVHMAARKLAAAAELIRRRPEPGAPPPPATSSTTPPTRRVAGRVCVVAVRYVVITIGVSSPKDGGWSSPNQALVWRTPAGRTYTTTLPNTRSKGQPRGRSWRGCRMAPGGAAALRLPASC